MIHANDVPRWQAKLDQIEAAIAEDTEVQTTSADLDKLKPERDSEARSMLNDLALSRDFTAFKEAADAWSRRPGPYKAFSGYGQMWLNQVANHLPDEDTEITDVLIRGLSTPGSPAEATERFDAVEAVTRDRHVRLRVPREFNLFGTP